MNTLVSNLNSEYLGASRFLYSKKAPERVYVYVESFDDIPFDKNIYLFIHGHTIMDHVVLNMLVPICNILKKENLENIKLLAKNEEDKRSNLNYYHREISKVEDVLTSMMAYKNSDLFQKIQNDICNYIKESF